MNEVATYLPLIAGAVLGAFIYTTAHVSTYRFQQRRKRAAETVSAQAEQREPTFFDKLGAVAVHTIIRRNRRGQWYGGGEATNLTPKSLEKVS